MHAVALARAAADAAQQAMEKEFQAIDALKERLQVRVYKGSGIWDVGVCLLPDNSCRCLGVGLLPRAAGILLPAVCCRDGCVHAA